MSQSLKSIIASLSLEEKAAILTGKDFWHVQGVEAHGIPAVMVTDGPHGLRKQADEVDHLGINESSKAICFPAGCALASSFDPSLAEKLGQELGKIAQAENVAVVLGPAMNIKRSPLCGRNFEYYSEDPLLTSHMATGTVKGMQSQHVGASPKHFLANNQEYFRMTSNSVVDDVTMREIYLAAFEHMVKEAKPWTMMSSYNKINGTYACESKRYLTDILRDEWGFDGYVMTDWGGLNNPVESLKAGQDLGMPGPSQNSIDKIVAAVNSGEIEEALVDQSVERILDVTLRYANNHEADARYDYDYGHQVAREIARDSAVLLKNDKAILPLKSEEKVLFVGEYVKKPRYQGGGSSHINPYLLSSTWDCVKDFETVTYAQGYSDSLKAQKANGQAYLEEAVAMAEQADKVVLYVGLPEIYETEGVDRSKLDMPDYQNQLIEAVAAVNDNVIVVLHNGSAVTMPWLDKVAAVLEIYLAGEACGLASYDLLYGFANPSGRLAETFPLRIEDTPAYPYFGVEREDVVYREGRLVGYRHYETLKKSVAFPFGYGLSYTNFTYSNLTLDKADMLDSDSVRVSVDVTNSGTVKGKEVVQVYVQNFNTTTVRPLRELRAFDKIELEAGETKTLTFTLEKRAFAEWSSQMQDWLVPAGTYQIQIGKNARDIVLEADLNVTNAVPVKPVFSLNSPMGDLLAHPVASVILKQAMGDSLDLFSGVVTEDDEEVGVMSEAMAAATAVAMPLRSMLSFSPDAKQEDFEQLIGAINQAIAQG